MKKDVSYLIGNKFAKGAPPNKTAFKKGQVPWNKGLKGLRLSPSSEFKKGRESTTRARIGEIRTRKNKKEGFKKRLFIKVAEPNVWVEHAKYVWKKYYGRIIKGDIVHHIDGDSLNDNINNLIALPRADHPIFHSRWGIKPLTMEQINFYCDRYQTVVIEVI